MNAIARRCGERERSSVARQVQNPNSSLLPLCAPSCSSLDRRKAVGRWRLRRAVAAEPPARLNRRRRRLPRRLPRRPLSATLVRCCMHAGGGAAVTGAADGAGGAAARRLRWVRCGRYARLNKPPKSTQLRCYRAGMMHGKRATLLNRRSMHRVEYRGSSRGWPLARLTQTGAAAAQSRAGTWDSG